MKTFIDVVVNTRDTMPYSSGGSVKQPGRPENGGVASRGLMDPLALILIPGPVLSHHYLQVSISETAVPVFEFFGSEFIDALQ